MLPPLFSSYSSEDMTPSCSQVSPGCPNKDKTISVRNMYLACVIFTLCGVSWA